MAELRIKVARRSGAARHNWTPGTVNDQRLVDRAAAAVANMTQLLVGSPGIKQGAHERGGDRSPG